jgi:chromosomal replication initiator protein
MTDGGDSQLQQQWARVRGRLRRDCGDAAFRSWLKPMTLLGLRGSELRLGVPTRFMRDWIATHYGARLLELWQAELPGLVTVEVVVDPGVSSGVGATPAPNVSPRGSDAAVAKPAHGGTRGRGGPSASTPPVSVPESGRPDGDAAYGTLDPRYTFERFVVGKSNEFAYAAAQRLSEAAHVPFNPLFLYGGVGLGKTHLMHAIAWVIRRRSPERRVMYLSAERFTVLFVRAIQDKDVMAFKDVFRNVDILMVDDLQFIVGKDSTQEEFFHTFNALVDQGRQVVLSADRSPSDLEGIQERLKSRLAWGLVADIHPTSYELRLGILQAKAEQAQLEVPAKVLEFLAHKITSNVRELEGALVRLAHHLQYVGGEITLETVQVVLHDLLRASDRRVTIEEIQKRVAEHYNIKLFDMHSARRARAVARPRQVAMYLAKQLTSRSLPEIGRKFGRDHTTVMHAVRKVEELSHTDAGFAEDLDLLRRMLEG